MKYTLLELVQTIASSMDSDEVNSITDSVESLQIAHVVRRAYFDMIERANLPEHYTLVSLTASGESTKPTLMTVPATVSKVLWVKYNCLPEADDPITMELLKYLPMEDFLNRMHGLNTEETNVGSFSHTIGSNVFTFLYMDDKQPQYYTTFDDNTIIFDSYDAEIDTTLQASKTMCYGKTVIPFTLSDSFEPDLDESQFPLLLNESLSLAWAELKQSQHNIAERNVRRGWSTIQKSKKAVKVLSDFDQLANFGRR